MTTAKDSRIPANLATVSDIYSAFRRGDAPSILDRIASDCRWEFWLDNSAQNAGLATLQPHIGPAGVAEFFAAVGVLEMHHFEVLDLLGSEQQVVAEVAIEYTTPTGRRLHDEELHLWTLDARQQVVRMRHYVDTAKHITAFGKSPVDHNKAVARRFVLEHNQADYATAFRELLTPDCIVHEYLPGVLTPMDQQDFERFIDGFRTALPDIQNSVEAVVAEHSTVCVRWTGRGTHTGAALMGVPAGGRRVTAHGTYVFRFAGDRIAEVWNNWDNLSVLEQLSGGPASA